MRVGDKIKLISLEEFEKVKYLLPKKEQLDIQSLIEKYKGKYLTIKAFYSGNNKEARYTVCDDSGYSYNLSKDFISDCTSFQDCLLDIKEFCSKYCIFDCSECILKKI